MHEYSEDVLVEQPTITLCRVGYETANGFYENWAKMALWARDVRRGCASAQAAGCAATA